MHDCFEFLLPCSLEALASMRGQLGSAWRGGNGGPPAAAGEVALARDVEMSNSPRGVMMAPQAPPQSIFAGADGGSLGLSEAAQVRDTPSSCGFATSPTH